MRMTATGMMMRCDEDRFPVLATAVSAISMTTDVMVTASDMQPRWSMPQRQHHAEQESR
ncbi:hypothetical protein [Rhodopirellula sp. SWK7]|uniref:hypothetical protein n=1 Tax=Rhodopirellula sp. SWK7 TaxID=595460 RepID=UPI001360B2E9|nr:hypothetical protein [Rhodopirellula sp. SWK7]